MATQKQPISGVFVVANKLNFIEFCSAVPDSYKFSFLKMRSGMDRTTNMMGRHWKGTYSTSLCLSIALTMDSATESTSANFSLFGIAAVMAVRVGPGLMVRTVTP